MAAGAEVENNTSEVQMNIPAMVAELVLISDRARQSIEMIRSARNRAAVVSAESVGGRLFRFEVIQGGKAD